MAETMYSVEHLTMLFENSRDAVFFMKKVGPDYKYIYVNKSAQKIVGTDAISKTVSQSVKPQLTKNIIHYYDLALKKGQQVEFEDYTYEITEVRKYETTVIPIHDKEEQYILALTREVAFNRDMQDKYLFMRSIFFKTFLSTVLVSKELELLEANPRFVEDFDINIEELHGKSFFDLPFIDPKSSPEIRKHLLDAQAGIDVDSQVITFVDKDEKRRSFTATFSPLTREDEVIAVFIILQEITSFIEQTQKLKNASHGLETFKSAIQSAADVLILNTEGIIVDANERFVENSGYMLEELVGQKYSLAKSYEHSKDYIKNLWNTIESGHIWRGEVRNHRKNGDDYWIDTTVIPLTNVQGEIIQYLSIQYDITDKKNLLKNLSNIERMFTAISDNTSDMIVVTDAKGYITYASLSYEKKLGYGPSELLSKNYAELLYGDSMIQWERMLQSICGSKEREYKIELQLMTTSNEIIWTEGNFTLIEDYIDKNVTELIMVSRVITERKELESKLMFMAYHDSLTQLPNRRYLLKEFPSITLNYEELDHTLAVIYVDGDNFKAINDNFGHDVGDRFLVEFGQALSRAVRSDDIVVRLGGDEFLVVLTGLSNNSFDNKNIILNVIDRIRKQLMQGWMINNHLFTPTSSMGVAIYPTDATNIDDLIDRADRAMYEAKQLNKNAYRFFENQAVN